MIIDIHAHTSNNPLWGLHTEYARISDLERFASEFSVKKIILLATYFPYKGTGVGNKEMLKRVEGNSLFGVFGSLDVMHNLTEGVKELEELLKDERILGIKLYPGYQKFESSDEKMFGIYEIAAKYSVPVMFHTGDLHHCCSKKERENMKKVATKYPCNGKCYIEDLKHLSNPKQMLVAAQKFSEVRFVLSHLGNPYFSEMREVMAECVNVYTDISGQFVSASHEDNPEYRQELKTELEKFIELPKGIERIMFGTDFPIQSYKDSIELVKMLELNEEDERKVFYDNAKRILKLS